MLMAVLHLVLITMLMGLVVYLQWIYLVEDMVEVIFVFNSILMVRCELPII